MTDAENVRTTLVANIEDTLEEVRERVNDLEEAYFDALGGAVISKVDIMTLLDTVERDMIAAVETAALNAAKEG